MNTVSPRNDRPKSTALGGAMVLGLASIFQAGLQLFVVALLARILTPADFGKMAAALIVVDLANNLAQMGIGQALVRRENLDDRYIRVAFTLSVAVGLAMTLLIVALSHPIAVMLGARGVEPLIQAISLSVLLSSVSVTGQYLLVKRRDTKSMAARKLLGYVVGYGVVGVGSALLGAGPWSLVLATIADNLVRAILVGLRTRHPILPLYDKTIARDILMFGGAVSSGRVINAIAGQADRAIISNLFGPIFLGLYTRAYQLMRFPGQIMGNVIDDIALPSFVLIRENSEQMYKAIANSVAAVSLLLWPAALVLVVLSDEIVHVLLGSQWVAATPLLMILALGMPFRPLQRVMVAAGLAKGAAWRNTFSQAIGLGAFALCVIVAARVGGLTGAAAGVSIGLVLQVAILAFNGLGSDTKAWSVMTLAMLRAAPLALMASRVST